MRKISKAITTIHDIDQLLFLIVEAVGETFGVTNTLILLWDAKTKTYLPRACLGTNAKLLSDICFDKGQGIIKWLLQNSRILHRSNIKSGFNFEDGINIVADFDRLRSEMLIPLLYQGDLLGVLSLGQKFSGRPYTPNELDLLGIIAGYAASAIHNSILFKDISLERAFNQSIFDNIACGIVAVDKKGKITAFNPFAEKLLKVSASELMGQNVNRIGSEMAGLMLRTLNDEEIFRHHELPTSDGKHILSVNTSLLRDDEGRLLGAIMFFGDTSKMRKLEDKVHGLEFWSDLSSRMAHEIKNPLVAIKTFTQLLPERYNDEDFRYNFAEIVNQAIDRINDITELLAAYAKPAALDISSIEVSKLIDQALEDIDDKIVVKEVKIQQSEKEKQRLLPSIEVDPKQIRQALVGILTNSIEFMSPGGTVMISARGVDIDSIKARPFRGAVVDNVNSAVDIPFVEIEIADTGPGIEPDHLRKVFAPFFSTKVQGLGLGLAIVSNIIQKHHGRIEIESVSGKGTFCRLYLPQSRHPRAADEPQSRIESAEMEPSLTT